MTEVDTAADSRPKTVGTDSVATKTQSGGGAVSDTRRVRRDALRAALVIITVAFACLFVYLAFAVPSTWFPRAVERTWSVKDLGLVRGTGRVAGDSLVITEPHESGITLVNVVTDFRSADYAGVAWDAAGLREDADVRLLWRSDVRPDRLNSTPIRIEAGRTVTIVLTNNPTWIGRISGLALAIHGPLPQPVVIRNVVVKPMGAAGVLSDRLHEWFAFEPWNGASINTLAGGVDYQGLPLPVLVAAVVALSGLAVVGIRRFRPFAFAAATPALLASFFLAGWLLLDARWTLNLLRQERDTATRYAGKDARERHLASEDGALYTFIEKALALMPKSPVRVFVAADADYFRGRAAYHLYPHNVYFTARGNALPDAASFRSGDWLLVYQRRGMQFDKGQGRIRWGDGQTLAAEAKLVEPGAALFLIR